MISDSTNLKLAIMIPRFLCLFVSLKRCLSAQVVVYVDGPSSPGYVSPKVIVVITVVMTKNIGVNQFALAILNSWDTLAVGGL